MAQIAESRARECRMREALRLCSGVLEEDGRDATVWHAQSALEATSDDTALREMIEAARNEERERIVNLLSGIDRQQSDDDEGWWETSAGSEFGAEILNKIRSRSDK